MTELNMKEVVGETFEDLTIAEMTLVQGSGDVTPESTTVCAAFASFAGSIQLVKTLKSKC
ncbi:MULTISPECIES: lichenicidin A2 family type 2 lantibiotic [Staphylococcus]|uniref:lichenicidin A2 family type 2 lantibiotic n=1 Tax=Staphylococcus TaxID=1279 RepID=UPI0005058873|nr:MULTISPECIES: lichenicidin A2 family type 2 lantibiotic [Staphylococcus]UVJ30100.1 lichenicidin A2 family type 2 lantibiotic [Staphylococcus aureus]CDR52645.1 type 2 lantibiotic%2C SP_1948 family [Staphylococcus schweitzeri]